MPKRPACLCIHGFGGEPFEVLPLVRALEERGHPAFAPLLPGHGETIAAFARTRWDDWLGALSAAYLRLHKEHGAVALVGQSMGGSLALRLAQLHRPAAVVVVSAPVYLYRFLPLELPDWRMPFMAVLRKLSPIWKTGPGNPQSRLIAPWRGYEGAVPLEALYSFHKALRTVRRELPRVCAPLLAVHALSDRSVPCSNAWEIARNVSSPTRRVEIVSLAERVTRHHLLTTHEETRQRVAGLCAGFVERAAAEWSGDASQH